MGNTSCCVRRIDEGKAWAPVPDESARSNVQKFSRPCYRPDETPYDVILGFLNSAREDGYIEDDELKELSGAIDDVRNQSQPRAARKPSKSLTSDIGHVHPLHGKYLQIARKASKADAMLPGIGFASEIHAKGYTKYWESRLKDRGSFEDYDESVRQTLESGLDCEAILHDRDFNCRAYGNIDEDTAIITYSFTQPINFLGRYRIPGKKLQVWLEEIAYQYSVEPQYHNWLHAFDVFQLSFLTLTDGGAAEYFNFQDCCSIMIAAIAHDVGHTGTNNVFHVKCRTALACQYNDRSPMENMHASLAFETLRKPDANFLEHLKDEDFDSMRSKIIDAILETDPSRHFPFVERLQARMNKGSIAKQTDVGEGDDAYLSNKGDRSLLLQGFVHMWDVGNGFRTWDVYKVLVASLEEEFHAQGDREVEMGLTPTMMMNREKDRLAAGQGFFLGKLVLPCFDLYAKIMKEDIVDLFRTRILQNQQNWKDLVDKHGAKLASELLELEEPKGVVEETSGASNGVVEEASRASNGVAEEPHTIAKLPEDKIAEPLPSKEVESVVKI